MITPRTVALGSALPALVLVTLVAVPGARTSLGIDDRGPGGAPTRTVAATTAVDPVSPATTAREEEQALALLRRSVRVGASLGFSGTQIVTAWDGAGTSSEVLDVTQSPGGGRTVTQRDVADGSVRPEQSVTQSPVGGGSVEPAHRALHALAAAYDLRPAGHDTVAGREAVEVVASRSGREAARLWLDADTGLLVRQDVLDDSGRLQRMSAYLELHTARAGDATAATGAAGGEPTASRWMVVNDLQAWRDQGFPCPEQLPRGYRLLDVHAERTPGAPVLQLTYGDGLSAVSVFLQHGTLDDDQLTGLTKSDWGDGVVHERHGWPELMVWQGGRTVITAVGDAEPDDLRVVLGAFPRQSNRGVLGSLQDRMGTALTWFSG